jgi:hypothetical protein
MFVERPRRALGFTVGRALARTLPEALLAGVYSPPELEVLLTSVASHYVPELARRIDPALSAPVLKRVARALSRSADALAPAAQRYATELGPGSLRAYVDGCGQLADRAGFLVCNDLGVAAEVLGEPTGGGPGGTPIPGPRLLSLLSFVVSTAYLDIREALDLVIKA